MGRSGLYWRENARKDIIAKEEKSMPTFRRAEDLLNGKKWYHEALDWLSWWSMQLLISGL